MKIYFLFCLLFCAPIFTPASVINELIVSVGDIAITSYDIQKMRDFDAKISPKRPTSNEALEKLINLSSLLIIAQSSTEYHMDESELRRSITSITNNPNDPNSDQRKALYEEFSDIYRMVLRSEKVKRGLMFNDLFVKEKINQPISPKEAQTFYNQNKAQMKDSPFPKFDLIIFAVESSPKWSLSQLSSVEEQMEALAKDLNTSSDYVALRRKYSSLRFTSYSGHTGLFTPDILVLQKKIPDEILGIALQTNLNMGPLVIPIAKNKGIYIPQPIPFRSTKTPTYLTLKIINIVEPKQLTFDEALPKIEEAIRYQKGEQAISELIKQRISQGQITLTPINTSYNSVFNKFKP